ncbi:site-specific integrase [Lacrimispora sp.]|uniref:site-specific integrase n=1 Tax=Lacrimispora sp. TaxID=2719234 RepID=UPI0028AFB80C|nr:site-specific integrase [Lacrimispora sp.]
MAIKRKDNKGKVLKDGESFRSDGRYQYRYNLGDGKRHTVYANTLSELREKEVAIQRNLYDNVRTDCNNVTLNDMFQLYMSGKSELKQSSRGSYIDVYKWYVKDEIGNCKIANIKYSDIKNFYNGLTQEKNLKLKSVELVNGILRPVFTLAVRDGYIRNNPTDGAMSDIRKRRNCGQDKRHALTIQEQELFISFVANSRNYKKWHNLFTVFLGTGCRVGEIIGLRWEDCDFENNIISINHNAIYRQQETGKCGFRFSTPKSAAGVRIVPMLSDVKKALLNERKKQLEMGLGSPVIDGYSGFVFTNREGNIYNPRTINRSIKGIVNICNLQEEKAAITENRKALIIRDFSVHNLRHTFCTRLCENESNLKVIQEIMGHSNIAMTLNVYAEASDDKKKEAFLQLEGKIKIS